MKVLLAAFALIAVILLPQIAGPAQAQDAVDPTWCLPGYVWRAIRPEDKVCVTPQSRGLVAEEKTRAPARTEPGPRDGVFFCLPGYVWRGAFDSDLVCVPPAARERVVRENNKAVHRTVATREDWKKPGRHTIEVGVVNSRNAWEEKRYSDGCGHMSAMPGPMGGMVGWGQSEPGGYNCQAFVLEKAVQFDFSILDAIPDKLMDRVVLSYDEVEAPLCPLVLTYTYRCWQGGNGNYEVKRDGCLVVRVPSFDWPRNGGTLGGRVPTFPYGHDVTRLNNREWDVRSVIGWQLNAPSPPLGGTKGFGLLLTGPPSIASLTAQDNTVCVSELTNIALEITYTVAEPGVFHPPH